MKLLLDTHIFLWYIAGVRKISAPVLALIRNPQNAVYLSVVSEWEIVIKYQLGRLPLPAPPGVYIPVQRRRHRIDILSLDEGAVMVLEKLPSIHRDPFDRMLISQALDNGLTLITGDGTMKQYGDSVGVSILTPKD